MTERPSRSNKAGWRGRHRHRSSRETRKWEAEHLIPERPEWMDEATYRRLAKLRGAL